METIATYASQDWPERLISLDVNSTRPSFPPHGVDLDDILWKTSQLFEADANGNGPWYIACQKFTYRHQMPSNDDDDEGEEDDSFTKVYLTQAEVLETLDFLSTKVFNSEGNNEDCGFSKVNDPSSLPYFAVHPDTREPLSDIWDVQYFTKFWGGSSMQETQRTWLFDLEAELADGSTDAVPFTAVQLSEHLDYLIQRTLFQRYGANILAGALWRNRLKAGELLAVLAEMQEELFSCGKFPTLREDYDMYLQTPPSVRRYISQFDPKSGMSFLLVLNEKILAMRQLQRLDFFLCQLTADFVFELLAPTSGTRSETTITFPSGTENGDHLSKEHQDFLVNILVYDTLYRGQLDWRDEDFEDDEEEVDGETEGETAISDRAAEDSAIQGCSSDEVVSESPVSKDTILPVQLLKNALFTHCKDVTNKVTLQRLDMAISELNSIEFRENAES